MTRDQALRLLGVPEGSGPREIEETLALRRQDIERWLSESESGNNQSSARLQADILSAIVEVLRAEGTSAPRPASLSMTQMADLPRRTPAATGLGPSVAPTSAELAAGEVLAKRYQIISKLGWGGMGVVYSARDIVRSEDVALKLLAPGLTHDPEALERFREEAKIVSGLAHPSIVRVYDLHRDGDRTFLTMEWLKGRDLRAEIDDRASRAKRFDPDEVRRIGRTLCGALQYAHGKVVHRDVKPENIWLDDDGSVKLMDFGIARLLRLSRFTSSGVAAGSFHYMSPEQLKTRGEVDHRADQFALAVVLYELLTGEVPIGVFVAPHLRRSKVPESLSKAIMKALSAHADDRHDDMASFAAALDGPGEDKWSRLLVASAIACLILLVGGAAAFLPRSWLKAWTSGTSPSNGLVRVGPAVPSVPNDPESSEARIGYERKLGQAEEWQRRSEKVETEILSDERTSKTEVERWQRDLSQAEDGQKAEQKRVALENLKHAQEVHEVASRVAELWRGHPDRSLWLVEGGGHLKAAQSLAKEGDFTPASKELDQAIARLSLPGVWQLNAREAVLLIRRGSDAIRDRKADAKPMPGTPWAWPEAKLQAAPAALAQGDGAGGFAIARDVIAWLERTKGLPALRLAIEEASRRTATSARIEDARIEFEAVSTALRTADDALAAGKDDQALAGYRTLQSHLDTLGRRVDLRLDELIASATKSLAEDHCDDAIRALDEAVALRPGEERATSLRARIDTQTGALRKSVEDAIKTIEPQVLLIKADETRPNSPQSPLRLLEPPLVFNQAPGPGGDFGHKESIRLLRFALAETEKSFESRKIGVDLYRRQYGLATQYCNGLAKEIERHVGDLVRRGKVLLDSDQFDQAAQLFGEAATLRPDDARIKILLGKSRGDCLLVQGEGQCLDVSRDEHRALLVRGNTLRVWDLDEAKELYRLEGHTGPVTLARFSPDGHRVASGSDDGDVRIWDPATGALLHCLRAHGKPIVSLLFTPDGRRLLSCSDDSTTDRVVKIWNTADFSSLGGFRMPNGSKLSRVTPSSDKVLVSDYGGLQFYDIQSSSKSFPSNNKIGTVYASAISPDGRKVIGSTSNHARIWDAATLAQIDDLDKISRTHTFYEYATNNSVVCVSIKSYWECHLWMIYTSINDAHYQKSGILCNIDGHAESMSLSPDGRRVYLGGIFDSTPGAHNPNPINYLRMKRLPDP